MRILVTPTNWSVTLTTRRRNSCAWRRPCTPARSAHGASSRRCRTTGCGRSPTACRHAFPAIVEEPYFADCFSQGVEERHAEEAIAVTQMVLEKRPELLGQTIEDAKAMADALDGVWVAMDEIVNADDTPVTRPRTHAGLNRSREAFPGIARHDCFGGRSVVAYVGSQRAPADWLVSAVNAPMKPAFAKADAGAFRTSLPMTRLTACLRRTIEACRYR